MTGHIQRDKGDLVVVVVGGDNQAVRRLGLEQLRRRTEGRLGEEEVMLRDHLYHMAPSQDEKP